jgi:hypothetical protein
MSRYPHRKRGKCEDYVALDVRYLHRRGLLSPDRGFSCTWSRSGETLGKVDVIPQCEPVALLLRLFRGEQQPRKLVGQLVPIVQTKCGFGGMRPWFRCPGCGRRAAKLYLGDCALFLCRLCRRLAYASQSASPATRAISKARKLRVRLGGGPIVFDPLPGKPPRMHRWTYLRLSATATKAQERGSVWRSTRSGDASPDCLPRTEDFP